MIQRMQEIWYEQVPNIAFAYPRDLEVYNTRDWQGWVEMPADNGSVLHIWTYLAIEPRQAGGGDDGGANMTVLVIVILAAAVVGVVATIALTRRRRQRHVEE